MGRMGQRRLRRESQGPPHRHTEEESRVSTNLEPVRQADIARWSDEQAELLRGAFAKDCTDGELAFFAQVCAHKDLDPFAGEIVAVHRAGRMVIQETVEGLRT